MAEELVGSFAGPLDSFSVNLTLENATNTSIRSFGISGRTAAFPVVWDSFGALSGPAVAQSTEGLDSEVVTVQFANFDAGEQVQFSGIDPDFTNDVSAGVRVHNIAGSRAMAEFGDGSRAFGEFEPTDEETLLVVLTR